MQRSGAGVPAVTDPRLETAAKGPGPFLSVYLTTETSVEDAAQRSDARWGDLRRELAGKGVPGDLLQAVDEVVPAARAEGTSLGVVAAPGGDVVVDHDAGPLPADIAAWGPVPVLTPLVAWRQEHPPYVVVLADRTGADIIGVRREQPPETVTAGGQRWRASKPRAGGWAHWRMQRRVEETWSRNARAVADEVAAMAAHTGAEVVLVVGEPKALGYLRPLLASPVAALVREVSGSRPLEGPTEQTADEVARDVRSLAAEHVVAVLDSFHQHQGAHDRATDGVEDTVRALQAAQVDALLVHDHRLAGGTGVGGSRTARGDPRTAWFDTANPAMVATDPAELRDVGVASVAQGPLVDVVVRAALVTGAAVQLVPAHGGPAEGVGALLRWTA